MPKKMKIVGLEEALENVPEEDREALRQEIKDLFKNAEPDKLPEGTRPVLHIGSASGACPKCGGKMGKPHTKELPPVAGGALVTFYDCMGCGQPYVTKAVE